VCKCKQIKKKINSPEQHAKDSNVPRRGKHWDTQHVRVCCGGNVERGEEEMCCEPETERDNSTTLGFTINH
jgi:hypothetical protein